MADLAAPEATTSATMGSVVNRAITASGSPAATATTSTSPMVSRNRRRLPMASARYTPGTEARAAVTSPATRRASATGERRSLPPGPRAARGRGRGSPRSWPPGRGRCAPPGRRAPPGGRPPSGRRGGPAGRAPSSARCRAPGSVPGRRAGTRRAAGRAGRCGRCRPVRAPCGRCPARARGGRRSAPRSCAASGSGWPSTVRARRFVGPHPEGLHRALLQGGEPGQLVEQRGDLGVGDHGMQDTAGRHLPARRAIGSANLPAAAACGAAAPRGAAALPRIPPRPLASRREDCRP